MSFKDQVKASECCNILSGHQIAPFTCAATAEISRTQLWQWLHVGGRTLDGSDVPIDFPLFDATLTTVRQRLAATPMAGQARVARASELLHELTHARELADFLTLAAYPELP